MSDLIERDKAINILDRIDVDIIPYADTREYVMSAIDHIRKELEDIPSARPKGEWVDWLGKGNEWECSVCKCSVESHGSIAYNYCPMCGASMVEREGE